MSYLDSGVSVIDWIPSDNIIDIRVLRSVKSVPSGMKGAAYLRECADRLSHSVGIIDYIIDQQKPDIALVEIPYFSQSAKSAFLIGMMWQSMCKNLSSGRLLDVSPSALKDWSETKRGDKKVSVYNKVSPYIPYTVNNNIIDSFGICLLTKDKIEEINRETPNF